MKKQSYDKINIFFKTHTEASSNEIDFVVRKVNDIYYSNIISQQPDGSFLEKNDTEKATIEDTITSNENLNSYLDNAKKFYSEYESDMEKLFRKKIGKESFIKSLGSNLLANTLYSIILLVIFWIAKDQLSSWLSSLSK